MKSALDEIVQEVNALSSEGNDQKTEAFLRKLIPVLDTTIQSMIFLHDSAVNLLNSLHPTVSQDDQQQSETKVVH